MHLPKNHRLTTPPSSLKPLTRRDPANPNAPGLQGNKNGPPGLEGNRNGPPGAATGTEEPASPSSKSPPPETRFADSPGPPPAPSVRSDPLFTSSSSISFLDITSSSIIFTFSTPAPSTTYTTSLLSTQSVATFSSVSTLSWSDPSTSRTPTPSSTFAVSVAGILASATPPVESLITPDVSASSVWGCTSTQYSIGSPSSAVPDASFPVETSPWTSLSHTGSMTATETEWGYHSPNGTALSKSNVVSPGQKAGIAVGIIAGFCFILTLIFLLFKWRSHECPKRRLGFVRHPPNKWENSRCLPHSQPRDAMPDSLLAAEDGLSDDPAWDHRATFAGPTVIEKTRQSLHKSLKLLRANPLGLNPVSPRSTGTRTPSRKSFASSFFRRRSAASTLQEQPGSAMDPQSLPPPLPPHAALLSPQPPAMSGRWSELAQSGTGDSPTPLKIPPQTLLLPWCHRNSRMTKYATESDVRSTKVVSGWVKPHYQRKSAEGLQEPEKELPLPPLPISRSSSLKAKVLHRSHSTTASKDGKEDHTTNNNDEKSAAAEQGVFGQSRRKQVQVVQRISGASVDSLVMEKLEAWQL